MGSLLTSEKILLAIYQDSNIEVTKLAVNSLGILKVGEDKSPYLFAYTNKHTIMLQTSGVSRKDTNKVINGQFQYLSKSARTYILARIQGIDNLLAKYAMEKTPDAYTHYLKMKNLKIKEEHIVHFAKILFEENWKKGAKQSDKFELLPVPKYKIIT